MLTLGGLAAGADPAVLVHHKHIRLLSESQMGRDGALRGS